jgi:hypothetical protein
VLHRPFAWQPATVMLDPPGLKGWIAVLWSARALPGTVSVVRAATATTAMTLVP